jgi:hypothetical protein
MKLPDQSSPRSDAIRQRRERQSHTAKQAVKHQKTHAASTSMPPVMTRVRQTAIPGIRGKKARNSRRRYNFSLDSAHGAEMSIPALPHISLSWRLLSLILVVALGFGLYSLWVSPNFRIDKPEVTGLARLTPDQIVSELDLAGKPVFLLNSQEIQSLIMESFPEVSNAEVQIELPNTVLITVTERTPVLTWVRDNMSYLVDENGNTFPTRSIGQSGSYPTVIASGNPPTASLQETEGEDLKTAALKNEALEQLAGVLSNQMFPQDQIKPLLSPSMVKAILLVSSHAPAGAKLIYDPIHGLGWNDRRGWNVYLGNEEEIEIKLQVYRAIMDSLKSSEVQPQMISVENIHAPYYRLNG